jgi:hypothetical protein
MNKAIFLMIAVANYICPIFAASLTFTLGSETKEVSTWTSSDHRIIESHSGLNGGAIGMGLISVALISSASFFLYKAFTRNTISQGAAS